MINELIRRYEQTNHIYASLLKTQRNIRERQDPQINILNLLASLTSQKTQRESYFMGVKLIQNQLRLFQEQNLTPPSAFLDFGTGEGASFNLLVEYLDRTVFTDIDVYEPTTTGFYYLKKRELIKDLYNLYQRLPNKKYDFINMWFVAGIDISVITEAKKILNSGGYLVLFDYNMTGLNANEVFTKCETDLERKLILHDPDKFYKRAITHSSQDFEQELNLTGLSIHAKYEISDKFVILIGKN